MKLVIMKIMAYFKAELSSLPRISNAASICEWHSVGYGLLGVYVWFPSTALNFSIAPTPDNSVNLDYKFSY